MSVDQIEGTTARRTWVGIAAIVVALVVAMFVVREHLTMEIILLGLLTGLATGLAITIGQSAMLRNLLRGRSSDTGHVEAALARDPVFSVLSDVAGEVLYWNTTASQSAARRPRTVHAALQPFIANPDPVITRLREHVNRAGAGRDEVVTRKGIVYITAHAARRGGIIWRLVQRGAPSGPAGEGAALPMMTVGPSGTILLMNEPMRVLLGEQVRDLSKVFAHEVVSGAMNEVQTKDGPVALLTAEYPHAGGRRDIFLVPDVRVAATREWGAFDKLPVPLLKMSSDGRVMQSNRLARELLEDEVAVGTKLSGLMEGLGRPMMDWLREVVEERATSNTEFLRVTNGKKERFVQVTLKRVSDEAAPCVIAVLHDATELKTLEAQFVQSQKMQAIGQLAGGVAHDFNNLLTAISGHCDLLLLRHDQGDPEYGDLVQINQNTNRAAALVGQLLAFSRKQTMSPELVDLRDTLADLTHLLNRLVGERVTFSLLHDPVLKPIRADKRQLEQVLMNLVVNARDAMPDGGRILVETEVLSFDKPFHRDRAVLPPGDYVTVKVTDEGIGIPADKLQKVFEPFYTSKRTGEGTGLGLSTAYGIVKQTGGYIFVDSTVGVGTCFTLIFPAVDAAAKEAPVVIPQKPAAEPASQVEGVVMLVEDEAPVRAFASRALRLRGYTVYEAASAEEALERLEDPDLEVDIFVTDVIMPGLDGPTWVRKALLERPHVKVVFMSGYAEDAFADDKENVENSVFLPKPFSLTDLTETVQKQLKDK
ncbi:multi-sensor hybrid histidine kinase [Poseidonocella pacifica]|uniref:histidine kinase n=1 Tax=Poseidonocella pacifica TaxID=871651 RepID=A0A1I0VQJ3_9RHOB|nr:ATP-binding protein [Poseidonocella pacifica]SFA78273.1 multi-sensor hybrid histidine kinase [Poseidonocella pacifica]